MSINLPSLLPYSSQPSLNVSSPVNGRKSTNLTTNNQLFNGIIVGERSEQNRSTLNLIDQI